MSARNGSIEILRIWAALGIVCFHAQTGLLSIVGYAGLPAFAILSFFLLGDIRSQGGPLAQPLSRFATRRAERLLVPWIVWMAIYLGVDLVLAQSGLRPRNDLLTSLNPFFGTRIHLWYLPFVFIGMLAVRAIAPAFSRMGRWTACALAVAASLTAALALPAIHGLAHSPEPGPQFLFAAPAIGYGVALAQIVRERDARLRRWATLGLALLGVVAAIGQHRLFGNSWIPFGIAVPLCCAVAIIQTPEGAFSRAIAPLTLGIYLIHPLIVGIVHRAALPSRIGMPDELTFVVGFAASALAVALLRRTPMRFAV